MKDEEIDYRRKNIIGTIIYTTIMLSLLVLFVVIGVSEHGGNICG